MKELIILVSPLSGYSFPINPKKIPATGFSVRKLKYESIISGAGFTKTVFYEGETIEVRKKYVFFGPKIQVKIPKKIFLIPWDCDDPTLTAEFWQEKIIEKLKIYERELHLKEGNAITT